jgi:hypothetical protein
MKPNPKNKRLQSKNTTDCINCKKFADYSFNVNIIASYGESMSNKLANILCRNIRSKPDDFLHRIYPRIVLPRITSFVGVSAPLTDFPAILSIKASTIISPPMAIF